MASKWLKGLAGVAIVGATGFGVFLWITAPQRQDPSVWANLGDPDLAHGREVFFAGGCASCHAPAYAFTDSGRAVSTGIDGIAGTRPQYQSRLDHAARSHAGAVGIMQVLPSTARALGIDDVHRLEANVHAGIRYLRELIDRYFDEPGIDELNRELFAIAAYNAGPSRIGRLRSEAAQQGLDPDVWVGQVERIAARRIGRETVAYVANTFRTYFAYRLLAASDAAREQARDALQGRG